MSFALCISLQIHKYRDCEGGAICCIFAAAYKTSPYTGTVYLGKCVALFLAEAIAARSRLPRFSLSLEIPFLCLYYYVKSASRANLWLGASIVPLVTGTGKCVCRLTI